jgi:glycosyltransferase involved in cell wall biosynthesis
MWKVSRALSSPVYDLVIFPTVYTYVPILSAAKKILFIHDVIPEHYPGLTLPTRRSRLFWKIKSFVGRHQADSIVTVSEYSKYKILETFHLDQRKVDVVGEAPDPIFHVLPEPNCLQMLQKLGIPVESRIILYVGGFGPHKNVNLLVRAFGEFIKASRFSETRLVLVGESEAEVFYSAVDNLREKIRELGLEQRVIFTGYLDDQDLVRMFNCAEVFVLPSLIEGYGLPAVEAAACGCPVIATRESALGPVFGEEGLFFNPEDVHELVELLIRVFDSRDLREQLKRSGLKAVSKLSWDTAASQLAEVIQRVGCS